MEAGVSQMSRTVQYSETPSARDDTRDESSPPGGSVSFDTTILPYIGLVCARDLEDSEAEAATDLPLGALCPQLWRFPVRCGHDKTRVDSSQGKSSPTRPSVDTPLSDLQS